MLQFLIAYLRAFSLLLKSLQQITFTRKEIAINILLIYFSDFSKFPSIVLLLSLCLSFKQEHFSRTTQVQFFHPPCLKKDFFPFPVVISIPLSIVKTFTNFKIKNKHNQNYKCHKTIHFSIKIAYCFYYIFSTNGL